MIPLPWAILGVVLLVGISGASGYWKGGKDRANAIYAQQAREAVLTKEAQDKALQAAAAEIAKLDVTNRTIHAKTEVITREVPVYRDCRHDPAGMRGVNEALAAPGQSPDSGKLPRPDTPGG